MTIQQAYDAWAASYDKDHNLTRDLDAQVTREVLGGQHVATLLELGCGTGKNTTFYAQMADRVLALDFSAAMIRQAQARASACFAIADLTHPWPCVPGRTDLAVSNLVLEHLADLDAFFGQVSRALAPGGQCFVCELHPFWQYEGKQATFEGPGGPVMIPAFVHHVSDFVTGAGRAGLRLHRLDEWWHAADDGRPPRLISFLFEKPSPAAP